MSAHGEQEVKDRVQSAGRAPKQNCASSLMAKVEQKSMLPYSTVVLCI